ncbi:hypothetical protein PI124_g15491 [Phytophthora idaei]|nr:hypothetical protein PI125_g16932 [Phytophthora idaei]KAG3143521.1 hypothetical protein PI126_g14592 [Phytophthora idaei]KAG3239590.1 hypothetical protein PI124_g15491 [Phytophthora idaei]
MPSGPTTSASTGAHTYQLPPDGRLLDSDRDTSDIEIVVPVVRTKLARAADDPTAGRRVLRQCVVSSTPTIGTNSALADLDSLIAFLSFISAVEIHNYLVSGNRSSIFDY